MITNKGFKAIVEQTQYMQTTYGLGYWLCRIKINVRRRGYWGKKDKISGEFIPYYDYWDSVNILTDEFIDDGDVIKVYDFSLEKVLRKKKGFGEAKFLTALKIYTFDNLTKGYAVVKKDHKRRRGKTIQEFVETKAELPQEQEQAGIQPFEI